MNNATLHKNLGETTASMMNSDASSADEPAPVHVRRKRYSGKNPRKFSEKYKELHPELYPEILQKVAASGKHPPALTSRC